MQIGLFTDTYFPVIHGVSQAIRSLGEGLEALGHRAIVIAPSWPGYTDQDETVVRLPSVDTFVSRGNRLIVPHVHTAGQLRSLKLDIVHTHGPLVAGLIGDYIAHKESLPHIHTVHTNFPELVRHYRVPAAAASILGSTIYPSYYTLTRGQIQLLANSQAADRYPTQLGRQLWRLMMLFCRNTDAIVSPSEHMARLIRTENLGVPIFTVPNSATPRMSVSKQARDVASALYAPFSRPDFVRAIVVSRLSPEKRIKDVIRAVATLSDVPVGVLIIGGGHEESSAKGLANRLGVSRTIRFAGWQNADVVSAAMQLSDFLILASFGFDNQPLVVLEALQAGLPVLYCDPALTEGLTPENSYLATPSVSGLAQGIAVLVRDTARRLSMAARARSLSTEFTPGTAAGKLIAIYQSTAEAKRDR